MKLCRRRQHKKKTKITKYLRSCPNARFVQIQFCAEREWEMKSCRLVIFNSTLLQKFNLNSLILWHWNPKWHLAKWVGTWEGGRGNAHYNCQGRDTKWKIEFFKTKNFEWKITNKNYNLQNICKNPTIFCLISKTL